MAQTEGSSAPSGWQIVLLLVAILIVVGYVWYRHSNDPEWNPYDSFQVTATPNPSMTPYILP